MAGFTLEKEEMVGVPLNLAAQQPPYQPKGEIPVPERSRLSECPLLGSPMNFTVPFSCIIDGPLSD